MNHLNKLTLVSLLVFATIQSDAVRADLNIGVANGWTTWQVKAVEDAPEMCCFKWRNGSTSRQDCHLDRDAGGFVNSQRSATSAATIQIFAYIAEGAIQSLRTLSSNCPITANSSIADLGLVGTDESVDILRTLVNGNKEIAYDAIASIAVHHGEKATAILLDVAENDPDTDLREESIFWMAQSRIGDTATALKRYLLNDKNPDIREHAAFAYSQSTADDVSATLIRQGNTDSHPDVRAQAWFWLAETGAPESEKEIGRVLRNDPDPDVREEAVFALSQLPEGRAVRALAEVLEDRELSLEIREQALFWLAQTESEEAFEYIDRLLSNN